MLAKPESCAGCPMYQDGAGGFCADELSDNKTVQVLAVAQNPGETEAALGRPLVGKTGRLFDEEYLPMSGLQRTSKPTLQGHQWRGIGGTVSVMNVLRCRWGKSNDLPPASVLSGAVRHCRQYDVIQPGVRLIVAMGALAWDTLAPGVGPVASWRGFLAPKGD